MQGQTSHWLIPMAFLLLSVTLIMGASPTASEAQPPRDADRAEIQPGPPVAGEEPKPQPPTPSQSLSPSGLEQPWQTSWEAFCGELQRLYKRGATKKEMNALFTGKSVTWEGKVWQIDRATNSIKLEGVYEVTTADNPPEIVAFAFFSPKFRSPAEIPDELKESAKVRFSMTLDPLFYIYTPETGQEPADKPSPHVDDAFSDFDDVFGEQVGGTLEWYDPYHDLYRIDWIFIEGEAKLLEYEKVGDKPSASPQPLPPSGLEQPWQTSWEAFCGELERLYKRGATTEKMSTLFTGKPVTWEGVAVLVDRENSFIKLEDKECRVTTVDNRSVIFSTFPSISLDFRSPAEIPDDLRESAKMRFSMTIERFFVLGTGPEWYDDIWPEERKPEERKPEERRPTYFFLAFTGETKLLEYEKVSAKPLERLKKLPEDSEQNLEGTGKKETS